MTLDNAYDLAKVDLFAKGNTFICSVFCGLEHKWNSDIPTARTNGTVLEINPDFFMSLNRPERVFLLAHEVWHVVLKHTLPSRIQNRNPKKWNYAADYYINNMLDDAGYIMPSMGLLDHGFDGKSVPEIYDLLPDDLSQQPANGLGDDINPNCNGKDESSHEAEIDSLLIRGAMAAKTAGKPGQVPGSVATYLDDLLNPKLPWNQILRNFVNEMTKNDYSWKRPNKRFFPNVILPSLNDEGLAHLLVYADSSGSVTDEQEAVFFSELKGIWEELKPKKITICTFDTRIQDTIVIENSDDFIGIKITGRGGTSLDCVYEHAKKHEDAELIIVFSDLECAQMEEPAAPNTIWVCLDNPSATVKFGQLIHVNS